MQPSVGKPWVRALVAELEAAQQERRRAAREARLRAYEAEVAMQSSAKSVTGRVGAVSVVPEIRHDRFVNEREWRSWANQREREARSSISYELLEVDRRTDVGVLTTVWAAVQRWANQPADGYQLPIDSNLDWQWRPVHYWVLRRGLEPDEAREAYQHSNHWKRTSNEQRQLIPACQRCDRADVLLQAHHLHYETVGAERIGIDLLTLCWNCHYGGEHRRGRRGP